MMNYTQIKLFILLTILAFSSSFLRPINHNSISLAFSVYTLLLFPNSLSAFKKVLFYSFILTIISLFPVVYFSFSSFSLVHVFVTSFGIFSCLELSKSNFSDYACRRQLHSTIESILIFVGVVFLGALVFGFQIESWRLFNIDTNGWGFYILTLSICLFLLQPRFSPAFFTSIIFLGYRSNTYFIMLALFLCFASFSFILKRLVSLKFSQKFLLMLSIFIFILIITFGYLIEFNRIINGVNLIFYSTGSFELLMQTDPRRFALTLQGIDLIEQLIDFFPFNITGFGYSTFNYLQAVSTFSNDFYSSLINVTQFDMTARPHNLYISMPATLGFPISFLLLFIACKQIFFSNQKIPSSALAAVMVGFAFNEFISVPSIYLIFGLSNSSYQRYLLPQHKKSNEF